MLASTLCGAMVLTGHAHAQQTATASGPCGTAINASGHAKVDVDVYCTVQDNALARKLVQDSQWKQRERDRTQDTVAAATRQRVEHLEQRDREIERRIEAQVAAAVARVREQAQGPDADYTRKRAYELLQRGETLSAITLLGEEADAAARAAASERDTAVSIYRQQAALQALSDLRQAMQALEKALQLASDDFALLWDAGDLAIQLGQRVRAESYYQRMHAVALRALEADPKSPVRQRDLSVSHFKLGYMQLLRGSLHGTQRHWTAGLAITERLAAQDPANVWRQRDLGSSHNAFSVVQQFLGNLSDAQRHAATALAIRERLVAQDPANDVLQGELSESHNRLGALQQIQDNLLGAQRHFATAQVVRERLAAQNPVNAESQRDLSVSHELLGIVEHDQGNLPSAQRHFVTSLAIRERLVTQDPANAEWQHDLSVSHELLGTVQLDQGNLSGAKWHFATSLAISERLAAQDPANVLWQIGLAASRVQLAGVCVADGDVSAALVHFQIARSILEELQHRAPDYPHFQRLLLIVEKWIVEFEVGTAAQ